MNDAVLFFDECESVFVQRGKGGSTLMTQLLTQLERHDGIVMLATNRAFDLDEAMYRRSEICARLTLFRHGSLTCILACPLSPCSLAHANVRHSH